MIIDRAYLIEMQSQHVVYKSKMENINTHY